MTFYEKNLQAILKTNLKLGAYLHSISTNTQFEVFMDKNDDININIYDKKNDYIFYKTKPIDEITIQYEEMFKKYSRHPFMWFYGFSNGLLVKMFLNLGKTIFVFEPNIELIYIVLNLFDFSNEIKESRLKIFLPQYLTPDMLNQMFNNGEIKAFLKTYFLEVTNNYYFNFFSKNIETLNKEFVLTIKNVIHQEGNDANDSLIGLNHHLKHIPEIIKSYTLKSIKKNSETAVIVSTGPSLYKQLSLLKKYQKYVTILCIDASLPILQKEKIKPDFVFSLERVEATSKFFENLDEELLKDTIFIPTSISHPKTIQNLKNFKKCISIRPFGYTKAFRLDKWGYIGIGMSAANMAFDFAYLKRFKNIVFVGQDLAFGEDGTTHSKGAIYGQNEQQYQKNTFYIKGYYGKPVKTSKFWQLFLSFFEREIPHVKKKDINIYNCTEGGAYIEGANHIPFKEFLDKLDLKEKSLLSSEYISNQSQEHLIKRSKKLIILYLKHLKCIKSKIENVFLKVMEVIEYLEKLNENKELEKINFNNLNEVISKIDTIKDLYENDKVLRKFMNITNPFIINAELELGVIMVRESDSEIEKKKKMIDWIYEHKSWLFFLAGAVENIIFILENNLAEVYSSI